MWRQRKTNNSIQETLQKSFNPKDFWGIAVEGRAHTNTSLYIQIYIVWEHDVWSCLASPPVDRAVFCTTVVGGLYPISTSALCLHLEALLKEVCSRSPTELS